MQIRKGGSCIIGECVEREELLAVYRKWLSQLDSEEDAGDRRGVESCIKVLEQTKAADVVKVVRGKWVLHKDGSGTCDQCHRTQSDVWDMDNWQNFCGHCGADMRGE